ncbi:dipeptidyl aminopeptidase acylaminoacyl peptidase [Micractinium conductrix]|uniref:Dipeptidyl aminopeptidase acylaminoacyl peptidase n=1 Tax=Micractinium conductrix TaxID=554055 RepID=A0A2P6VQ58_9CHLO|nr:dipeptidyl aminopeptidase acylaminoacyl peptidase [Micractinium conductrix]|eukprot:PSC76207.1 dipeptidyl aminopeptidase acylaminoacyl peptidase [Micractinium conductrix]
MDAAVSRLEAATGRLEALEVRLASLTTGGSVRSIPGPGAAAAHASAPAPPAASAAGTPLEAYRGLLAKQLATLVEAGEAVGGQVLVATRVLAEGFLREASVVEAFACCRKPSDAELQELVAPFGERMVAASELSSGPKSPYQNHFKLVSEAMQALSWVVYTGPDCGMRAPAQHVEDAASAADFYANKVLMEWRAKDPAHAGWVQALKSLMGALKDFCWQHFPAGPTWNAAGVPVKGFSPGTAARGASAAAAAPAPAAATAATAAPPKPPAAAPRPPPPPPPDALLDRKPAAAAAAPGGGGGNLMAALFADINKGSTVTSGLRKVTDDMKTKNQTERSGAVPAGTAAAAAAAAAPAVGGARGKAPPRPPRLECEQGRKWVVENQVGNRDIIIENTEPRQTVYIFNCSNSTIRVRGKVNAITLDSCSRTGLLFDMVVATCELVNSSSVEVQCTGAVPTVAVDKCDGCQLYLPRGSLEATDITTAKSSEVNVIVPGATDDADPVESAIPEQFVTRYRAGRWLTEPAATRAPPTIAAGTRRLTAAAASGSSTADSTATAASQPAMAPLERQYGEWESPITSELITSATKRLGGVSFSPGGDLFWLEGRPTEQGRQVLVRRPAGGGAPTDVTPPPDSGLNVRTRVQEYGGGEYVAGPAAVYFSNFGDQRLCVQDLSSGGAPPGAPRPLTAADSKQRFADGDVDEARNRLLCVVEDHSGDGEAVTSVGAVDLQSGAVTTLVSGADFYACPRLSPDGSKLAWVTWQHPNMPWDDTQLWVADVAPDGSVGAQRKVAGRAGESVVLPQWGPDGSLYFISDAPDGWWNLKMLGADAEVQAVLPMAAEFAAPMWVFGQRPYLVLSTGHILAVYSDPKKAGSTLALIDPATRSTSELATPFTSFSGPTLAVHEAPDGGALRVAAAAGSALQPAAVVLLEVDGVEALKGCGPGDWQVVRTSADIQVDAGYLSEPQAIEFPTEGGRTAFLNYYAPKNKDFAAPEGALPPLLVKIHGGPTSQASTAFNLGMQYWTSRGFAVADINYGGSTGYGRAFRQRLCSSWGIVDVDDCSNAARHLVKAGLADPARLCIDGGSAGGYTTLACLAFRDVFSAGASHYGVADLELLAKDTHKFESRYLDGLIGPYPEAKATYEQRSPINALDGFTKPVAFFQGLEDKVVPPNQAEEMFAALTARGIPTALVLFEGEQHGFRQAPNIRRALDGELYFYGRVLGFQPALPADFDPIEIVNAAA